MTFEQGLILLLLGMVLGGGLENGRRKRIEKQIKDFWRNQNEEETGKDESEKSN